MKKSFVLFLIFATFSSVAQSPKDASLRSVLLEQLKTTHNKKEWFVPMNTALEGLTPEQVVWKDGSGNHSVGQLAYHLVFWNERQLADFRGEKKSDFNGDNEQTFDKFDQKMWTEIVSRLDRVMTDLEKIIETSDEASLKKWAATVANISAHNAYHTGQIIFVRKLQGAWDPDKGVK